MKRKVIALLLVAAVSVSMLGGCSSKGEKAQIQVFIAASLKTVMTEIAAEYNKEHPNTEIIFNADSSGKLLTQIQEGFACDIFFSAAQKQMDELEKGGQVIEGTRKNVLNNQLVVITRKESGTAVTGLGDLDKAKSIALADGSVPAGRYTRQALIALGILGAGDDSSKITTQEVSDALGGVEISEEGNVSKVLTAVVEDASEVGTTYYSDTFGFEDQLTILETVSYDLTGYIIYPVCRVTNKEASKTQTQAADDFYQFILSDKAKTILDKYYFDTNVQ